ncbi:MAG: sugar phosphate isomerase/epimerase family protein [Burkholderiales bacterium]
MNRAIGLAALTVLELAPPEQVTVAAQAGHSHVGLRLIPVAAQLLPAFEPRELERRLDDTGIRVPDVEVFRLAPPTQVADFEPVVAAAARLRASELLVHGADADEARLADSFGQLCDLAAGYGLNANLEPMPWVDVSNLAKAKRLLAAVNRSNAALLVDAIHFFRAGDSFGELKGVHCKYTQLCDAPAERPADLQEIIRQARAERLFPGEGGLDLRGLMAALPAGLPVSLEVPCARPMSPLERARRALEATRKLLSVLPDPGGRTA